jgi:predicted RNase H-like HicB family nuclease
MKHATDTTGQLIDFDFSRPGIPSTAISLQPELMKQEEGYSCSWSTDTGAEITGNGETPEDALQNWDKALQDHLRQTNSNKKLADQLAEISAKRNKSNPDARKVEDTQDVKEGLPIRSEINLENNVDKKKREHTADDSNQNGSE